MEDDGVDWRAMMTLTAEERIRLTQIRMNLEKHRVAGTDVSSWDAEFLLGIIDKINKRNEYGK